MGLCNMTLWQKNGIPTDEVIDELRKFHVKVKATQDVYITDGTRVKLSNMVSKYY